MKELTVRVELNGQNKQGMSQKDPAKPAKFYCLMGGYISLPGIAYPQATQIYVGDPAQVKAPGHYDVPLTFTLVDGRPACQLDFSRATAAQAQPATRPAATSAA